VPTAAVRTQDPPLAVGHQEVTERIGYHVTRDRAQPLRAERVLGLPR
jgi:hypothetical protein